MSNKLLVWSGLGLFVLSLGVLKWSTDKQSSPSEKLVNTAVVESNVSYVNNTDSGKQLKKRVTMLDVDHSQVVTLVGPIDYRAGITADEITKAANNSDGEPVYLLISSPGGSVLDGALIINAIEASPVPVYTVCMDIRASMAAIIHQYGTERWMVDRAILMFHDAAGGFQGYFPHIKSRFTTIDKYIQRFNSYIANRSGISAAELVQRSHNELWMDSEDSTANKFNDKLVHLKVYKGRNLLSLTSVLYPMANSKGKSESRTMRFFDTNLIYE